MRIYLIFPQSKLKLEHHDIVKRLRNKFIFAFQLYVKRIQVNSNIHKKCEITYIHNSF
jgi:hypothetical protein